MSDNNREDFTSNTRLSFVSLRSSQGVEPTSVGIELVAVLVYHSLVAFRFDESSRLHHHVCYMQNDSSQTQKVIDHIILPQANLSQRKIQSEHSPTTKLESIQRLKVMAILSQSLLCIKTQTQTQTPQSLNRRLRPVPFPVMMKKSYDS